VSAANCARRADPGVAVNKRDYSQLVCWFPAQPTSDQRLASYQRERKPTLRKRLPAGWIDNNSHATSYREIASTSSFVSGRGLQEFRVQSNGYSAEYGHSAGGW